MKSKKKAARELGFALDQTIGSIASLDAAVLAIHTLEALEAGQGVTAEERAPRRAVKAAHIDLRGCLLSVKNTLRYLGAKPGQADR